LSDEALKPMTNSIIYWVTWRSGVQNVLKRYWKSPLRHLYFYGSYCWRGGFV